MIDEKAREQIADQASRLMAAGWRGNPNMSGDDRDFMTPSMRRKHDEKVRSVVDFVLSQFGALRPGSTGEAEGWRDLASMPENDWVLAWSGEHVEMACRRDGRWLVANSYGVTINPSAWRPLPSPPSAMLAATGGRDE